MATPASHAATANTLLTAALAAARSQTASAAELDVVHAHALLGKAAGTGTPYLNSEAALADCDAFGNDGARFESYRLAARAARAWGQLA